VFELKVAAPLVPVVVKVIVPCFELNVLQSALDKAPLFVALAVGTFKVITGVVVLVATLELKSVPLVPIVKAATLVTVPTPLPPTNAIVPFASGNVNVLLVVNEAKLNAACVDALLLIVNKLVATCIP